MKDTVSPSLLMAIRRVLWERPALARTELRAALAATGSLSKYWCDDRPFARALAELQTRGEITTDEDDVRAIELRFRAPCAVAPPATANGWTLLGQIRSILRKQPEVARDELRAELRARRRMGADGFGGRRLLLMLRYLRRRGEIVYTPTQVHAVMLLPAAKRKRNIDPRASGPRVDRWKAAAKRERALAKRARKAGGARGGIADGGTIVLTEGDQHQPITRHNGNDLDDV